MRLLIAAAMFSVGLWSTNCMAQNYCADALGREGALDELYQMERVLHRDLSRNYNGFCRRESALTLSYADYLYGKFSRRAHRGRMLSAVAAPIVEVASITGTLIFSNLSVSAAENADEDEWFAGLGEAVIALAFLIGGSTVALTLLTIGLIRLFKNTHRMQALAPYTSTPRKMNRHIDIVFLPFSPAFALRF